MTQKDFWKIFPDKIFIVFLKFFRFYFQLRQKKPLTYYARGKTIIGNNLNRWKGMANWIIHNLWIITLRADYSRMRCAAACITTHAYLSSTSIFVRSNIATWSTSSLDSGPWKCSISDSHWCRRAFHRLSTETLS